MAEFSKQYCALHDPELPHDFDIDDIYNSLGENEYIPIICEGLGFIAIGDIEGECQLAYDKGNGEVEWRKYRDVLKENL